jgi:hypothetical protein
MADSLNGTTAELKLDLLFEGVRYTDSLRRAGEHSFPNFAPYRFAPGEDDPTGAGKADIPYMLVTDDGTHCRIKVSRSSPWWISGSRADGYELHCDRGGPARRIDFEPAQRWMAGTTPDGVPRAMAGISLHGDMAVVNVAPGCEYFLAPKQDGVSMRCTFCTYGAPDARLGHLGQEMGVTPLPERTYRRMQEVLSDALAETELRHIYLVGGSLVDPRQEGVRFIELARRVQEVVDRRVRLACGSGALPIEALKVLHGEKLVDTICFDLEIWSEPLFARICPGKHRYVGYRGWIEALENAVALWGRERVYSAMVAGVEFEPELGLSLERATEIALEGSRDLCSRGIIPIYSLYWPPPQRELPEHLRSLRRFFERLQLGYHEIRREAGLEIWDGFMCRRCAYMQVECDLDHALAARDHAA